ncbi:MAG: phosphate-starvation-inducible PsiE family protein [Anaerolineae bacterium]
MHAKPSATSVAAMWLHRAESFILVLIAIVLILIAVLLLGNSVVGVTALLTPSADGSLVRDVAINILDSVLLVMMTMEIVYTVAVSLESHQLVAEPFLIIGAIAAIRRMLVITAESTKVEASNPAQFFNLLIELGLLALIVVAMAISIYVLRRSAHYVVPAKSEPEKE